MLRVNVVPSFHDYMPHIGDYRARQNWSHRYLKASSIPSPCIGHIVCVAMPPLGVAGFLQCCAVRKLLVPRRLGLVVRGSCLFERQVSNQHRCQRRPPAGLQGSRGRGDALQQLLRRHCEGRLHRLPRGRLRSCRCLAVRSSSWQVWMQSRCSRARERSLGRGRDRRSCRTLIPFRRGFPSS